MKAKDLKEDRPSECNDSSESNVPMSCWQGKRIEGVVFDMDGTLTNSIDGYFEVVIRKLKKMVMGELPLSYDDFDHGR